MTTEEAMNRRLASRAMYRGIISLRHSTSLPILRACRLQKETRATRAEIMSCFAVGCTNRFNKTNKTQKFYRIPSTRTPFKANWRRLWLQAIRRSDWNEQMIKG